MNNSHRAFPVGADENDHKFPNRIVIIGAGIVGSALAKYLSEITSSQIFVIDSSLDNPQGSTAHAPGFVGQLNEIPTLTALAKDSVAEYKKIPNAFGAIGGLEIASTTDGIESLKKRCKLAVDAGLSAKVITSAEAAGLAPHLHETDGVSKALHFPDDGTANAQNIVAAFQKDAKANGVEFLQATVQSIEQEDGKIVGITTSSKRVHANQLIFATGIWTASIFSQLSIHLPIIPVAHAYVHSAPRPPRHKSATPFVRWPERHIYARDHGSFDGFGSYDHAPIAMKSLSSSAIATWDPQLDVSIDRALETTLPRLMNKDTMKRFNGLFAVTPDRLPLVGPINGVEGLWVAAAVWVTHAAGVARLLADIVAGRHGQVNDKMKRDLDPNRFAGQDERDLEMKALRTYNDIYNSSLVWR